MKSKLSASDSHALLGPDDPNPVETVNTDSIHPVVLVCEHAGQAIPKALGCLGLPEDALQAHIAWDIGAEAVSRLVAERLGACLILQRYSRLVIDCNRPPESDSAMPVLSDGVAVPANMALTERARQQRIGQIFEPYQQAVSARIVQPTCQAVLSIHSFTRSMAGFTRPWDVGFLYRQDIETSKSLATAFTSLIEKDRIGMNQPYQVDDASDWFVPRHGEATGLRHSLIEICNDCIDTSSGQQKWADWLCLAIQSTFKKDLP
jgi:predicted N-formylglutamate amidohydrolase